MALGHVHVWATFEYGNVVACYPGSPVASYASSKGGYLAIVDLDEQEGVSIRKHRIETLQIKTESMGPSSLYLDRRFKLQTTFVLT